MKGVQIAPRPPPGKTTLKIPSLIRVDTNTLIVNYRKIVQKNKTNYAIQNNNKLAMIHDVIYSLLVLIEKFAFFNKQLQRFIISVYLTLGRYFFKT